MGIRPASHVATIPGPQTAADYAVGDRSREAVEAAIRRLEKQDRERAEFVGIIAHELKNTVTAMLVSLELVPDRDPGLLGLVAENLGRSTHNLERMISELLCFARTNGTELSVRLSPVNVVSVVCGACHDLAPLLSQYDLGLSLDISDPDLVVMADEARLQQVMLNLLINACKFSRRGGTIAVSVRKAQPGFVRVAVEDCAPPIEEAKANHLFLPYYRGERTREIPGSGLGLYICRRLIEAHGGEIRAESRDSGNTFSFTLPLVDCCSDERG